MAVVGRTAVLAGVLLTVSELEEDTPVEHAARKVIGHGILLIGNIGYPVVAIYIIDAEQVQAVYTEPDILEGHLLATVLVVQQTVTHTELPILIDLAHCIPVLHSVGVVGRHGVYKAHVGANKGIVTYGYPNLI